MPLKSKSENVFDHRVLMYQIFLHVGTIVTFKAHTTHFVRKEIGYRNLELGYYYPAKPKIVGAHSLIRSLRQSFATIMWNFPIMPE